MDIFAEGTFFSDIGLNDISQDQKKEFIDRIMETVKAQVYLSILEQLSEEDRCVLDELDPYESVPFLLEHGIDILYLTTSAAIEYKNKLVSAMQLMPESKEVTHA